MSVWFEVVCGSLKDPFAGAAPGENPLAFLRDHEMFQQIRCTLFCPSIVLLFFAQVSDPAEPKHALNHASTNWSEQSSAAPDYFPGDTQCITWVGFL